MIVTFFFISPENEPVVALVLHGDPATTSATRSKFPSCASMDHRQGLAMDSKGCNFALNIQMISPYGQVILPTH
jgi:hypothetical protein